MQRRQLATIGGPVATAVITTTGTADPSHSGDRGATAAVQDEGGSRHRRRLRFEE